MVRTRLVTLLAVFAATAMQALPATAQLTAQVGQVSRIEALAEVARPGQTIPLAVNSPIHMQDIITTGDDGRLAITFSDGTIVTLGELARLQVDQFVFQPTTTNSGIDLTIKGAFRFVTGQITSADGIRVHTPVAIIGIRGTDFFAGPVDGSFSVVLFEGAVAVTNPQGATVLQRPGQGIIVEGPAQAPGPATVWAQDKIDRAIASVSFP